MAYNQYDLANTSLVKTGNLTEMYLPLWFYSSSSARMSSGGNWYLSKGSTGLVNVINNNGVVAPSSADLHHLSNKWSPNQKFALEVSIYSDTSGVPAYASLIDSTDKTTPNFISVSGSSISTTANSFTLLRSGQFTLIPGHSYTVQFYQNGSGYAYITKASLIAFLL